MPPFVEFPPREVVLVPAALFVVSLFGASSVPDDREDTGVRAGAVRVGAFDVGDGEVLLFGFAVSMAGGVSSSFFALEAVAL